ncbi:MAG TPA: adenosylcobinamide-GDP ribazoletransferase [Bacteroidales bacterium]|nr:adenosylcobinamide-GDP ribazoletransferase [Bacteroidales bacterium]HQB22345.1 adenosylcobinamide-GDP ribazoletransferase [Bacteroidales bacterium]
MKRQIQIFFAALMFYTRIPCPKKIDCSNIDLNQALRYYPLVGMIVGTISFLIYWGSFFLFGHAIAVVASLVAGVLTTGAFHEDGFADAFDGFGGGWTKEKILEIMKDSRIGTYGTIALILLFALKILSLYIILPQLIIKSWWIVYLFFILYHSLARLTSGNIVFFSQYARDDLTSKVKPVEKHASRTEIICSYVFGLIPLTIFSIREPIVCIVILPLFLLIVKGILYFKKWLNGYTGDCLGCIEQFAEIIIMLTFVAIWKFM